MSDAMALRDLLAKVEAGLFFSDLARPAELHTDLCWKSFNGETDAAIALCQSVLPGWHWGMDDVGACLYLGDAYRPKAIFSAKGEPARALLICILRAMIWEAEQ
jgi:hypothetical protein